MLLTSLSADPQLGPQSNHPSGATTGIPKGCYGSSDLTKSKMSTPLVAKFCISAWAATPSGEDSAARMVSSDSKSPSNRAKIEEPLLMVHVERVTGSA